MFKINKPILIKGEVQSILEITEGPILIDLSNFDGNDTGKVIFSECNFVFDLLKIRNSLSKSKNVFISI